MLIVIKRLYKGEKSIIGEMTVDGIFECFTLEDVERPVKIKGETAIPKGTYKVIINESNRFKRQLPLLLNVPGFEGVRIHAGNTDKDTEGCILVGMGWAGGDTISMSRIALGQVYATVNAALTKGEEVTLTVT